MKQMVAMAEGPIPNVSRLNVLSGGAGAAIYDSRSFCKMQHRRSPYGIDPLVACCASSRRRRSLVACSSSSSSSSSRAAVNSTVESSSSASPSLQSQNGAAVLSASKGADEKPAFGILFWENFTIRCYEVGTSRRASIQAIANLLQEVACNQVRYLGFSTDGFATTLSMRKHQLIWVTIRMHIEMEEYPLWGEVVEIQTWFQESRNGTRRDWLLKNAKTGSIIGRATSTWVMMNQETRRFGRINQEIREEYLQYALHPPKFAFPEEHSTYQRPHLPRLADPVHHVANLKPMRADLDMNQHVNNVAYIGWMIESLPASIENTHDLRSIVLEFKRECKHDDSVESMAMPVTEIQHDKDAAIGQADDDDKERQFWHLLTLQGSKVEINRGWTQWVKKKPQ